MSEVGKDLKLSCGVAALHDIVLSSGMEDACMAIACQSIAELLIFDRIYNAGWVGQDGWLSNWPPGTGTNSRPFF